MEFKDEEIIRARKAAAQQQIQELASEEAEKEREESIFDGSIHIEKQEVRFQRKEIEELKLSLYIPETFERMEGELKEIFYPLGNAPSHVYADTGIPLQLTLNYTGHIVPDDGIPKLIKMAAKLMENYGPKVKILSSGVVRLKEHNIGIIEFGSKAVDSSVYNVMFYISIENQALIGNINFANRYSKRLVPVAKEMIDSIEIQTEEKDGDNHISES